MNESGIKVIDGGEITTPGTLGHNVLQDTSKFWATNIHAGKTVVVRTSAGETHTFQIAGNSPNTLVLETSITKEIPGGSRYIISGFDMDTVLRNVFGGGKNISSDNPLQVYDPKVSGQVEDVEGKLDHSDYGLAALKAAISSVAGGVFYGSFGPRNVEVGNEVDFGQVLYDPAGNVITTGEITPGTYEVRRVRAAVDSQIVAPTASSEAAGRVYMTYNFPDADWQVGDIFYVVFSGISVTVDGITTDYPDLYIWGRVVREADVATKIDEKPEWGDPTTGTHTTSSGAEETVVEASLADPFQFYMLIDLVNMAGGDDFTFRVYQKVDGASYRLKDEQRLTDAQTIDVYQIDGIYGDDGCDVKVTVIRNSGTDRAFPYRWNYIKEV